MSAPLESWAAPKTKPGRHRARQELGMKSVQRAQRPFDLAKPRGPEEQLEFDFSLMQPPRGAEEQLEFGF